MIKKGPVLEAFEREQMQNEQSDYFRNLLIFEALYREAEHLKVFPLEDPLEGIDVDVRLARALNVRGVAGKNRPGTG